MKKYPVIYNGQNYEVRWEKEDEYYDTTSYLCLYKKFIIKKKIFQRSEFSVNSKGNINSCSPTYRIDQVKTFMQMYDTYYKEKTKEENIKREQIQLKNWSGIC